MLVDPITVSLFGHYDRNPLSWIPDENSVVLALPPYQQVTSYSCSFVAGLIVLHCFFPSRSDSTFLRRVGLTEGEAGHRQLVGALRRSGIRVSIREDLGFKDIAAAIAAGRPVVVTVQRPEADHWVIVCGYGRQPRRV